MFPLNKEPVFDYIKAFIQEVYYHTSSKYNSEPGILENKRDVPLIVSLTTIPERIHKVYLCTETLLRQSIKPDYIILWVSEAIQQDNVPCILMRQKNRGLQIRFCRDIGPYTKIIYTLKEHPESIIVTIDDDFYLPRDWLKMLFESYLKEPQYIHCYKPIQITMESDGQLKPKKEWVNCLPLAMEPSFHIFPEGYAGVLYPPGSLHDEVLNEEVFTRLCPLADDIWLKAMSILNGVCCKNVKWPNSGKYTVINGTQSKALRKINDLQNKNDEQIKAVFDHYSIYNLLSDG